jgi:hypothetical protein
MIGVDLLRELIESVILTGKVQGVEPVSLLLIAAPESGKTSVALSKDCKAAKPFSDVTGRGLHMIIKENREATHIVINDLVAVLSHKEAVNRYTLSQLNAITEEGITSLATPAGIETLTCGKRGIITSLTSELVIDQRRWWNKVGFTSRMLPFFYKYPADLIVKIKDDIDLHQNNGSRTIRRKNFPTPVKQIHVDYPENFIKHIRIMADARAMFLEEQGMRRLKQYHSLAQGHALWRRRQSPRVSQEDVDFIKQIDKYVSYSKPETLS